MSKPDQPLAVVSSEGLGPLAPERDSLVMLLGMAHNMSKYSLRTKRGALMQAAKELAQMRERLKLCGGKNCMGHRVFGVTQWVTEQAAEARVAAERERCAAACEHFAADLTDDKLAEALRDMAALMRRMSGPNVEVQAAVLGRPGTQG